MRQRKTIRILAIVLVIAAISTLFAGCTPRTSIKAEDFKDKMAANGYLMTDATSQFSNYEFVQKVWIASDASYRYQIEFYQLENEDYAKEAFAVNKQNFEGVTGTVTGSTNISMGNYAKFTQIADGRYMVVTRIDNTMIYIDAEITYKAEIEEIMKDLDY